MFRCTQVSFLFSALVSLVGCAEGYMPEGNAQNLGVIGGPVAGAAADPTVPETPPMTPPAAGAPAGDPCAMGQQEECDCGGGALGMRVCVADQSSATGGSFGECGACVAPEPEPMQPQPTDTPAGDGMSGPAPPPPAAPTTSMACGTSGVTCDTAMLQCCRDDGTCGVGVAPLCF